MKFLKSAVLPILGLFLILLPAASQLSEPAVLIVYAVAVLAALFLKFKPRAGVHMAQIFQSNVTDRQLFSNARAAMLKAKISATAYDNAVVTQGYLRLIQPIATGQQVINFPVLQNQTGAGNATRSDEVRLPQQNAFFVGQMYFTIFKGASATDYAVRPQTYPNAQTFTSYLPMYGIYNGRLNVQIDQSVIARAYSMRKFLNIPQTQQIAADGATANVTMFDGTAMMPWEPNVVFPGTAQIEVSVILPASLGTIDANVYGCWDFFGVEAQNVCLGAVQ